MGILICWWGQRSYIKVKGHLRSSCNIGWKCENGFIWKVEVRFEPNLVYWYDMWTFIWSCSQRSCTKVTGHLRSSCKIGWKCENGLILKVEVWFEPNLVYWYNMETFICSCGQMSQVNVKGHLRSTCKIRDVRLPAVAGIPAFKNFSTNFRPVRFLCDGKIRMESQKKSRKKINIKK